MTGSGGSVGIVGLGLMGGSLARDLASAGWTVYGADEDPETERKAMEAGVVTAPIDPGRVDILVLAVPVRAASVVLRRLAPALSDEAVVTDVGSTKRSILRAAEAEGLGRRLAGSHPVAGDHRSGFDAARPGLYDGATVWVCPTDMTTAETLARIQDMWRAVGAEPVTADAAEHDRLFARSSHLPQLLASSLAAVLARNGVGPRETGAGGRDMTRLAGSDPDMWADILVDNRDEVGPAVDELMDTLIRYRHAIREQDDATLRSLLASGRAWRE